MFFQLVIMCHVIACFWNALLEIEDKVLGIEDTWIEQMNLKNKGVQLVYMEAFYWSVATIMLIGTKGETFLETMFVTITLLLTVGVFAYLISTISMIIQELNVDVQQYKSDLEVINRYIKNKKIFLSTQQKIRGSIEYFYQDSKEINNTIKAQQVLDKLPKSLKEEIQQEINTNEMDYFKFITKNFSKKTQELLKKCMIEKNLVTNEIIFHQDQIEDIGIYYIQKGEIDLYNTLNDKEQFQICRLRQGTFIGDSSFLSGQNYIYTAKTITFARLLCIKRQDFLDIIKHNKDDFEKFAMIQHQFRTMGFSKYYNKSCLICGLVGHQEKNCNLLNFCPNKGTVYLKNILSFPMENRQKYFRREQKINSLDPDLIFQLENEIQFQLREDEQFLEYFDLIPDFDQFSQNYYTSDSFSDQDDELTEEEQTLEDNFNPDEYFDEKEEDQKQTSTSNDNQTIQNGQNTISNINQFYNKTLTNTASNHTLNFSQNNNKVGSSNNNKNTKNGKKIKSQLSQFEMFQQQQSNNNNFNTLTTNNNLDDVSHNQYVNNDTNYRYSGNLNSNNNLFNNNLKKSQQSENNVIDPQNLQSFKEEDNAIQNDIHTKYTEQNNVDSYIRKNFELQKSQYNNNNSEIRKKRRKSILFQNKQTQGTRSIRQNNNNSNNLQNSDTLSNLQTNYNQQATHTQQSTAINKNQQSKKKQQLMQRRQTQIFSNNRRASQIYQNMKSLKLQKSLARQETNKSGYTRNQTNLGQSQEIFNKNFLNQQYGQFTTQNMDLATNFVHNKLLHTTMQEPKYDYLQNYFNFFINFEKAHDWQMFFPFYNLNNLVTKYKKYVGQNNGANMKRSAKERKHQSTKVSYFNSNTENNNTNRN